MFGENWYRAITSAVETGLAERHRSYSTGREGKNEPFPKAIRLHRRHVGGRAKQYKLKRAVAKQTNHTLSPVGMCWNVACPVAFRIRFTRRHRANEPMGTLPNPNHSLEAVLCDTVRAGAISLKLRNHSQAAQGNDHSQRLTIPSRQDFSHSTDAQRRRSSSLVRALHRPRLPVRN